jgi:hypothetical protein
MSTRGIIQKIMMAGVPGFEPGHGGIKTRCLTAWLYPNIKNKALGMDNVRFELIQLSKLNYELAYLSTRRYHNNSS